MNFILPLFLGVFSSASWAACSTGTQCRSVEVKINYYSTVKVKDVLPESSCAAQPCSPGGPHSVSANYNRECNLNMVVRGSGGELNINFGSKEFNYYLDDRFPNDMTYTFKPEDELRNLTACLPDWAVNAGEIEVRALQKPPECAVSTNDFITKTSACADRMLVAKSKPAEENLPCGIKRAKAGARYNKVLREVGPTIVQQMRTNSQASIADQNAQIMQQVQAQGFEASVGTAINAALPLITPTAPWIEGIATVILAEKFASLYSETQAECGAEDCVTCGAQLPAPAASPAATVCPVLTGAGAACLQNDGD
jgi:hypothetical protein